MSHNTTKISRQIFLLAVEFLNVFLKANVSKNFKSFLKIHFFFCDMYFYIYYVWMFLVVLLQVIAPEKPHCGGNNELHNVYI